MKANIEIFAQTLLDAARSDERVYVVTSDSRGSGKLTGFAAALPERVVEVGIAEQNLVGVAAGLAAGGKRPVAVSPASFLTTRALEQVKHDVCYSDRPVILAGISAGVSYGALGSTHHSLHDLAVLRAIHNINVYAPADAWEMEGILRAALAGTSPAYIRIGKSALPELPRVPESSPFEPGRVRVVREGTDACFVASGETVWRASEAAMILHRHHGISAGVLSVHTVKPLDTSTLLATASRGIPVITVEEHSLSGGIGEACARLFMEQGHAIPFRAVGFPDEETVAGSQTEIMDHYGMAPASLAETMYRLVENR